MKSFSQIITLLVLVFLPAITFSSSVQKLGAHPSLPVDIKIVSIEFGVTGPTGKFAPTNLIQVRNSPGYGWRMVLESTRSKITWQEIMRLPAPAKQWGVGPQTKVSFDRTTATTTVTQPVAGRVVIEQFWSYADGDPFGDYSAEVKVEGVSLKTFKFNVQL